MCGTLRVVGGNVDASDGPHVEEVTKKVHIVWLHRRSRHAHKETVTGHIGIMQHQGALRSIENIYDMSLPTHSESICSLPV